MLEGGGVTRGRTRKARKTAAQRRANGHTALEFGDADHRPLHRCVASGIDAYFEALDDAPVTGLYDLVISEVERPLLESVMRFSRGNQTRAAEVLGLNRGTLRSKLLQHGLLED